MERNYKFKVGDRVEVVSRSSSIQGLDGVIVDIDKNNRNYPYHVAFDEYLECFDEYELEKIS